MIIDAISGVGGGGTKIVQKPTVSVGTYTYDGTTKSPTVTGFDSNTMVMTGGSAINAGSYTLTIGLKNTNSMVWDDLTTADLTWNWSIGKATATIPTVTDTSKTYNGSAQSPTITGFDSTTMSKSGDSETNAGDYTLSISLQDTTNYKWSDDSTTAKTTAWNIAKASLTIPTVTGSFIYDGTSKSPTISDFDSNTMVEGGTTSAINVGTYTVTFDLNDSSNYKWSDNTTSQKSGTWAITTEVVEIPTVSGSFTYDGTSKSATITDYDPNTTTQGGTASATDAGTYTVTFDLNDPNYKWSDNTTSQKTGTWSIAKADQTITLSANSATLDADHLTATVTVSGAQGTISVSSSDSTVATASVSGNTITISNVNQKSGSATITVSAAGTTNYNPATDKTISVTCSFMTLVTWANGTDEQIAAMVAAADAGQIDLYQDGGWRVGDERTVSLSAIAASGTYDGVSWSVGESQSAQTITLVLMARDHYTLTNATSGGRTKCSFVVGVKNCLGTYGYMNSTATNTGSWSSSARRAWCNGGFRQALPSALRGIFKQFKVTTATEYNASTTTDTNDYFALFAEKEIFDSATYSNTTEANALSSITWYETSSNRIKKQGDSGSVAYWWERSPYASGALYFCVVGSGGGGGAGAGGGDGARGLSPFGCL